jgi:hypothetical protein
VFDLRGSGFQVGDEIVIRPLWTSVLREEGKRKIAFLTYALPKDSEELSANDPGNFACHACAPLIGAAIFVLVGNQWQIESSSAVVSRGGGFGSPPVHFRTIQLGPQRFGIEISDGDTGGSETTSTEVILVAWKGKVRQSLRYVSSDNNKRSCGRENGESPCYANRKTMALVRVEGHNFFDLLLTLAGTGLTDTEPYRSKAVHGVERLTFADGYYKTLKRIGDRTEVESEVESHR